MKGVIFDMGGVIIDSEPVHVKLEKELLGKFSGDYFQIRPEDFMGTTDAQMWSAFKAQFKIGLSVEKMINIKRESKSNTFGGGYIGFHGVFA